MTCCTLVAGGTAAQRLAAIAACLDPTRTTAVIAEGLQAGSLPCAMALTDPASRSAPLRMTTIATGCPHCDDGLVMRVTLDRVLRHPPALLYISLADQQHLPHLQQFLSAPPYDILVTLAPVLQAG